MGQLPALTPRKVIRVLEKEGFVLIRQKGSHMAYGKGNFIVTVPYHNRDLKMGTLKSIIEQAGYKVEEFIELL